MRQNSLITLVSVLALFLGGCPANDNGGKAGQSTPTPVAAKKRVPAQQTPNVTPFASPLTARQPTKATAVAGLVRTLPPDARVNQVRKNLGRSDPFAAIPTTPIPVFSPAASGGNTNNRPVPVIPQLPQPRRNAGNGNGNNQPGRSRGNVLPPIPQPRQTLRPPIITRPPNTIPTRPGIGLPPIALGPRPLPNLPEPTLARGIEVTGVAEVGGVASAIVKVPNEPSRTVREGDRLSNGQVLVKRIEVNRGPSPVVILEQYGQEVARQVGEKPVGGPGQPEGPTASLGKPPQEIQVF
jgi:hypothetical protein